MKNQLDREGYQLYSASHPFLRQIEEGLSCDDLGRVAQLLDAAMAKAARTEAFGLERRLDSAVLLFRAIEELSKVNISSAEAAVLERLNHQLCALLALAVQQDPDCFNDVAFLSPLKVPPSWKVKQATGEHNIAKHSSLSLWQKARSLFRRQHDPTALHDAVAHQVNRPEVVSVEEKDLPQVGSLQDGDNGRSSFLAPPKSRPPTQAPKGCSLTVYTLGPFQVYQNHRLVTGWTNGKSKAIFKFLLGQRERRAAKEVLMDTFWQASEPVNARNNLNVTIFKIRNMLRKLDEDGQHILLQDDHYYINPDLDLWVDAEAFSERFREAKMLDAQDKQEAAQRAYEEAIELYRGDYLEEDRYGEWYLPRQRDLKRKYLNALNWLSNVYLEQENFAACVPVCYKILAVDDCIETTHQQLMRCYSRQGQHQLALRQYHHCLAVLRDELDVCPSPETDALYDKVRHYVPI